jgi:two-component system, chemotaxis family, sensor kinase Cph1
MRRERCASNAIVADVLRELVPETESRPMDIEVGPLPELEADPTLLYQVFYNLIANAVKYTRGRDPARIRIDCTGSDGHETTFRIRDNGAGFDMKYAGKLFGVFQRLHHASEFEGTGIGLANVRRIVERHGGRIWAEGTVDAGATFFFSIPVAPPADDNASSLNSNSRGASDVPAFA